jgi:hypothetical protein
MVMLVYQRLMIPLGTGAQDVLPSGAEKNTAKEPALLSLLQWAIRLSIYSWFTFP